MREDDVVATRLRMAQEVRLLAEQGVAEKQFNVGVYYETGLYGYPKNSAEAVKWYRLAADQGFAAGQYNLGVSYAKGVGVPQSYVEAVKWYRCAADQGLATAQCNLGQMYAKCGFR